MRLLMVLWLAPLLYGQSGAPWTDIRAKNPPDVKIMLRLLDSHAFREGELIRAEMSVPEHRPMQGPPPAEHWQFGGLLLDPAADCGTVAKPCFVGAPGGMDFSGLMNGPQGVSDQRQLALNAYLPALAPGKYRIAALARKLVRANLRPEAVSYIYADPPQYAVSDNIELEIVSATADWIRQTIANSVATLNGGQPRDSKAYEAQHDAAQQLAFLRDRAAWTASLELLPKEEGVLLSGLSNGRPPGAVCELMQARVAAPAQSVSSSYLQTLT